MKLPSWIPLIIAGIIGGAFAGCIFGWLLGFFFVVDLSAFSGWGCLVGLIAGIGYALTRPRSLNDKPR